MATMTARTSALLDALCTRCDAEGLTRYPAVAISSGVDPSVRFIGASISVLKPLFLAGNIPAPGVYIVQPAIRTHCLKTLTDPSSRYHWSSYFVQMGALVQPSSLPLLARVALEFLRHDACLPAERIVLRASSTDLDLLETIKHAGVSVEIDGYSQSMYRHRFGLEGWGGRNVNYAIRCGDVCHDIGNLILIENDGVLVAIELAIGVSVLICRIDSLPHPIMSSPVADHLAISTWDQIKCGNALEASAALAREGLRPIARGRGRTFREYLQALSEVHRRAEIAVDEVHRAAMCCELGLAVERVPRVRAADAIAAHLKVQESARGGTLSEPEIHERALVAFDDASSRREPLVAMSSKECAAPGVSARISRRLIPAIIPPGSTIGIVAPSSAIGAKCPRRFERGLDALERLGYRLRIGKTARAQSILGYSSASPRERAEDLNAMFGNQDIDAIVTTIGGYAVNHILEHLNLRLIANNPKFIFGYSDTTLLQAALWQAVGLTSVAGPALLPQFGEFGGPHPFTLESFRRVATAAKPLGTLPVSPTMVSEINRWDVDDDHMRVEKPTAGSRVLVPGEGAGWVAPVNIESLLALAGTEWFPDLDNTILLLEAAETTSAARFHQGMCQLRQMGVFRRVSALVFGRFDPRSKCSPQILESIALESVSGCELPVVSDIDFGHTDPLLSLPWGVMAHVRADAEGSEIVIEEAAGHDVAPIGDGGVCSG